ncbi:ribonuclease H-like domain-containing protein [Tanacetum coccineum]
MSHVEGRKNGNRRVKDSSRGIDIVRRRRIESATWSERLVNKPVKTSTAMTLWTKTYDPTDLCFADNNRLQKRIPSNRVGYLGKFAAPVEPAYPDLGVMVESWSRDKVLPCGYTNTNIMLTDLLLTIRTVLPWSLRFPQQSHIHQLDVKNAFLHGHLTETIYMHHPPGFTDSTYPDYVCLLHGFKQASRAWFQRFASYTIRANFHHSKTDSSLFIFHRGPDTAYLGPDTAYLLLYVDDIILTASSTGLLQLIISSFHNEFYMTDIGPLNCFLGILATRTPTGMFLSQSKYATKILKRANMLKCNPCKTLVDTEKKLGPDGPLVTDPTLYRSLAGALQYLTFTRQDLSYDIQQLCLYMHDPREPHIAALKRVLCYIRGTPDPGLQLYQSSTSQLISYTDAYWVGCPATRRSTSGYCVFLSDNLLSWSSKRQHTLSRSSAEAEYRGVANVIAETAWIRNLVRELEATLFTATLVYCDNVSNVYMSSAAPTHEAHRD